jgi:hypothetical protein
MPPRLEDLLFALEERFWMEGAEYYRRNLAHDALMVFPDSVLVSDQIAGSLKDDSRWTQVDLEEHRLIELRDGAALVTYKATARRKDSPPYVARASSAYVNDGHSWKLAFHQQTPVA